MATVDGGGVLQRWMVAVPVCCGGGWRQWVRCVSKGRIPPGRGGILSLCALAWICLIVCFRHLFVSLNPSNPPYSSIHVSGPSFIAPSPLRFLSTLIESSGFPLCSHTQLAP